MSIIDDTSLVVRVASTAAFHHAGAVFSPCEKYRYMMWRTWGELDGPRMMFIGLNPSTATESVEDPTVRRCIRFAKDWGYAGMFMMNAFAFRATDPKKMQASVDPNGPRNNDAILEASQQSRLIIAAWGVHCPVPREREICAIVGRPIHCLGWTKGGRPRHPLYVRADEPVRMFYDRATS